MIVWKKDVVEELKKKGYSTYRIQKEKIMSGQTLNNLYHGKQVNMVTLDRLCKLLKCQPSSLIMWVEDEEETDN